MVHKQFETCCFLWYDAMQFDRLGISNLYETAASNLLMMETVLASETSPVSEIIQCHVLEGR
jgi:hypothetical protein